MRRSRWPIASLVGLVGALCTAPVLLQAEPATTSSTASATLAVKKLSVNGMTCFGCIKAVQNALEQVPGVTHANVNLETSEALVEYDPAQAEPEALIAAVTDAGFEAALKGPDQPTSEAASPE